MYLSLWVSMAIGLSNLREEYLLLPVVPDLGDKRVLLIQVVGVNVCVLGGGGK